MVREVRIALDDDVFLSWKSVKDFSGKGWKDFFQDYIDEKKEGKVD